MTRKKDPNSRSGQIRSAIKLFPTSNNKTIAELTGENLNLIAAVRYAMAKRRRKQAVVEANIKPMTMVLPMTGNLISSFPLVQDSAVKITPITPWDYIAANGLGYLEGNVIERVSRWRDEGGIDMLKQAQHYLAKLIEVNE